MRIKIKRLFRYQVSATKTGQVLPGEYDVPKDVSFDVAAMAMKFGGAKIVPDEPAPEKVVPEKVVPEKTAPENKVVETPENKARVARKTVRRRSNRTKPDQ